MKTGPLAGYQVDSLKVTLTDGSFHPVDSDAPLVRQEWGIEKLRWCYSCQS
jgi:translation elongation factor EF-G